MAKAYLYHRTDNFSDWQRMTLSALHEFLLGEPIVGAHRARQDVQALMRCCAQLLHRDML